MKRIKFSNVAGLKIPQGEAVRITAGGEVLWNQTSVHYVSLGDSIAAGHAINPDWVIDYGTGSQYGENGNTSTVIVPNSYTSLISRELKTIHGEKRVSTVSFAKSGDRVDDLIAKLNENGGDNPVTRALAKADIVTICIGANDVLEPALSNLEEYVNTGDQALNTILGIATQNLSVLAGDGPNSYTDLFNRLTAINPEADYVFTTIYNPYKYLWIEDGVNGFFKPLFDLIPDIVIDIDGWLEAAYGWDDIGWYNVLNGQWNSLELDLDIGTYLKDYLLNSSASRLLYNRVNGLNLYAENLVTMLNNVLRDKIAAYGNPHIKLADTKAVFDPVPDRPVTASKHYYDLVNVDFNRGFDLLNIDDLNWKGIWQDAPGETEYDKQVNYLYDLLMKNITARSADEIGAALEDMSQNINRYVNIDYESIANDLIPRVVENVIAASVDPHPRTYGHHALSKSFAEALGWTTLPRRTLSFSANGGTGVMASKTMVALDGLKAYTTLDANSFTPATGYYFTGWNTRADGSGTAYADGGVVGITEDTTLYAQWSNMYTVTYKHTRHTIWADDNDTGHQECYALYINGELKPKFGSFASGSTATYRVPYGSTIYVWVDDYMPSEWYDQLQWNSANCDVYLNGVSVAHGHPAYYQFNLTGDLIIDFRWKTDGTLATFNAQSWEDCYITTQ